MELLNKMMHAWSIRQCTQGKWLGTRTKTKNLEMKLNSIKSASLQFLGKLMHCNMSVTCQKSLLYVQTKLRTIQTLGALIHCKIGEIIDMQVLYVQNLE